MIKGRDARVNKIMVIAAGIVLMTAGVARAQEDVPVVSALIRQLGDDDLDARERATGELIAVGESAKGALKAAAQSNDPEVKHRAELILRVVEIKGKVKFSEKLLRWYPEIYLNANDLRKYRPQPTARQKDMGNPFANQFVVGIYRELASNPTVQGRYGVFLKLTAFDSEKWQRAVEVENSDIGEVVKLLAAGGYEGLSAEEKSHIAEVCGGRYRYRDTNGDEGAFSSSSDWIITGVAGDVVPLLKDQDADVRGSAEIALKALGMSEEEIRKAEE